MKSVSLASRPLEPTPASSTRRDATAAHAPRGGAPRVVRRRAARARFLSRVSRPRPGLPRGAEAQLCFRLEGPAGWTTPRDGARPRPRTRARQREDDAPDAPFDAGGLECVSADLESVVVASVTETERSGRNGQGARPRRSRPRRKSRTRACACASVRFARARAPDGQVSREPTPATPTRPTERGRGIRRYKASRERIGRRRRRGDSRALRRALLRSRKRLR